MTAPFRIKIQLFGAFRQYAPVDSFELHFSEPTRIANLRQAFQERLQSINPNFQEALLAQSVFASADEILPENALIQQEQTLMILPPISGG